MPEDGPGLSRIQEESWRQSYRGIFPDLFLDDLIVPPERWGAKLDSGVGILIGEVDAEPVGYCSFAPSDLDDWGEIRAIYVLPALQGLGYGSRLLAAGLEGLEQTGFDCVLLWVIDRNIRARRFYEGRGWRLDKPIRIEEIAGTQVTLVRYSWSLRDGIRRCPDPPRR